MRKFIRNRASFLEDHGMHHPADSFGDTGSACGPLLVGLAATLIALGIGLGIGLVAGYAGGAVDAALMRLTDLVLAFPFLLLVIAVAAVLQQSGAGVGAVLIVLGIVGWLWRLRGASSKHCPFCSARVSSNAHVCKSCFRVI